jgi:hypothetical protein
LPNSEVENASESLVESVNQRARELSDLVFQPGAIDQLKTQRHRDRGPGKARHLSIEKEVAGEAGSIQVRSQRHDVGLPDTDSEHA